VIVNSVLEDAKQDAMNMVKEFLEDTIPEPEEE
jgi:hypothetical protein